jgi:hypothetical protein
LVDRLAQHCDGGCKICCRRRRLFLEQTMSNALLSFEPSSVSVTAAREC